MKFRLRDLSVIDYSCETIRGSCLRALISTFGSIGSPSNQWLIRLLIRRTQIIRDVWKNLKSFNKFIADNREAETINKNEDEV